MLKQRTHVNLDLHWTSQAMQNKTIDLPNLIQNEVSEGIS